MKKYNTAMAPKHGSPIHLHGQTHYEQLASNTHEIETRYIPHAKHVNEMLLSDIVLFVDVTLECSKNIPFFDEVVSRPPLDVN